MVSDRVLKNTIFFALKVRYRSAVAHRLHKKNWLGGKFSERQLEDVASKLDNVAFAKLFVEAQFHCMPTKFCTDHFNRLYPPATVCFGGDCWQRYDDYKERGQRDGV